MKTKEDCKRTQSSITKINIKKKKKPTIFEINENKTSKEAKEEEKII